MATIEIQSVHFFSERDGMGNLRGMASVKIASTVVHDFRIVHVPGQSAFVQPPQRMKVKDGKTQYFGAIVELPEPVLTQIRRLVLQRYEERGGTGQGGKP